MSQHAQLRSSVVAPEWHEAVAVVCDVAAQVVSAGGYVAPTADQLSVGRDGVVAIAPGRVAVGSHKGDGQLVLGLGRLLKELLDSGPAPAQLSTLAETAGADPSGFASVDEFTRALAFFERPDRRAVLASLAERILASEERVRIETELQGLTRKARTTEPPPSEKARKGTPTRRRTLRIAAAALLAAVAIVVTLTVYGSPSGISLASSSAAVAEAGGRAFDAIRTKARTALSVEAAPAAAKASVVNPAGREAPRRPLIAQGRATAHDRRPSDLDTVPIVASRVTLPDLQPDLIHEPTPLHGEVPAEQEIVPVSSTDRTIVYEPDDQGVEPPELVRPQLPTVPTAGVDAARLSVVEVLVSENGSVDQVRVVTNPASRRYYTAMLVAAVKTWKFRPAMKDGAPVRYRVQMALTQ